MAMKIGTQMPALDGATEWFGGTQAHAEAEVAGTSNARSFLVGELQNLQRQLAARCAVAR
jgi:hypothetical protein